MSETTQEDKPKKKNGRPTKLTQEMIDRAEEYIEMCKEPFVIGKELATVLDYDHLDCEGKPIGTKRIAVETLVRQPPINHASLAMFCGVSKQRMYDWREDKDDDTEEIKELRRKFRDCISDVQTMAEKQLNQGGIEGYYNSTVVNRVLAAHHGYMERKDVTTDNRALPPAISQTAITSEKIEKATRAFEEAMRP